MVKSLYSGVSGLKTHQQRMDVIGNNIANVNTTGYKTNVVTFADVYYQTKRTPSGASANLGGVNPRQVGYGVKMNTTTPNMTQSGFTYSDSVFDLALDGEGFFQLMDSDGSYVYTRAGVFNVDEEGNLVNANGLKVCGVSGDFDGQPADSNPIRIVIPATEQKCSSAVKQVNGHNVTVSVNAPSDNTDMSVTFNQSTYPYSTFANGILNLYIDLEQNFETLEDFQNAIKDAISTGGVELPDGVELNFEIEDVPTTDAEAVCAANQQTFTYTLVDDTATDPTTGAADGNSVTISVAANADEPGEYANNYKIVFAYSSTEGYANAVWDENTLTVTIGPNSSDDDVNAAIAAAVTNAAGTNAKKDITITVTGLPTSAANLKAFLNDNPAISLKGGKDSFFTEVAKSLSTFNLRDGRLGAEQSFKDLQDITVQSDGTIIGLHAVHGYLNLGRIDIVTFDNPNGLSAIGGTNFVETVASGEAKAYIPGEGGAGKIVSGALEMSNVDLSQEFTDMITTQRGYQANSRVITTSDTMLEELLSLKR